MRSGKSLRAEYFRAGDCRTVYSGDGAAWVKVVSVILNIFAE